MDVQSPEKAEVQRWRKKALKYSYLHKQYTRAWRKLSTRIEELVQDNLAKERDVERLLEALRAILPQLCTSPEEQSMEEMETKLKDILGNRLFCAIGIPHRLPETAEYNNNTTTNRESTQTTVKEHKSPSPSSSSMEPSPSKNSTTRTRRRNTKRPPISSQNEGYPTTQSAGDDEQQTADSSARRTAPLKLAKVKESDTDGQEIEIAGSQTSNEETTEDDNGPISASVLPARGRANSTGSDAGEEMQSQQSEDCAHPDRNFAKQNQDQQEESTNTSSTTTTIQVNGGVRQRAGEADQQSSRSSSLTQASVSTRAHQPDESTQSQNYYWGAYSHTTCPEATNADSPSVAQSVATGTSNRPEGKPPVHPKQTTSASLRARLGKSKNTTHTSNSSAASSLTSSETSSKTTTVQSQNSVSVQEESVHLMNELGDCDFDDDVPNDAAPQNDTECPSSKMRSEHGHKYAEVVRNRDEREAMRGFNCDQCRQFYANLGSKELEEAAVQCSSRHRHHHTPPSTPDGYWENLWIGSPSQR